MSKSTRHQHFSNPGNESKEPTYAVVSKKIPFEVSSKQISYIDTEADFFKPKLGILSFLDDFKFKNNPSYDCIGNSLLPTATFNDNDEKLEPFYCDPYSSVNEQIYTNPDITLNNEHYDTGLSECANLGPIYDDPLFLHETQSKMQLTRSNLREIRQLGIGNFGQVFLAETVGVSLKDLGLSNMDNDHSVSISVAVKEMKNDATLPDTFEREIQFMSKLDHENVIKLLAVSSPSEIPFVVMEYMEYGDLSEFLPKQHVVRSHPPMNFNELSIQMLLSMAIQIASGMSYLASFNYVHRDLATRNCLINASYTVKIADFGLSRNLYDSAYYRVKGKAKMPIRWMATECFYGKFSEKTDVWSYGVTVWEIYSLAKYLPYCSMTDEEVITDALKGLNRTLLSMPELCPNEVFNVIETMCWTSERSSFCQVEQGLMRIQQHLYGL